MLIMNRELKSTEIIKISTGSIVVESFGGSLCPSNKLLLNFKKIIFILRKKRNEKDNDCSHLVLLSVNNRFTQKIACEGNLVYNVASSVLMTK